MRNIAEAAILLSLAACSYDWTVAPDAPAAGDDDDSIDAAAAPPAEAGPVEAGLSCDELVSRLAFARADAKSCPTLTADCTTD